MHSGSQLIYIWCKFLILLWTKNKRFMGMAAGPQITFGLHWSRENYKWIDSLKSDLQNHQPNQVEYSRASSHSIVLREKRALGPILKCILCQISLLFQLFILPQFPHSLSCDFPVVSLESTTLFSCPIDTALGNMT